MYEFLKIKDVSIVQIIEENIARKYNSIGYSYADNKFLIAIPFGMAIFLRQELIVYLEKNEIVFTFVEFSKEEIEKCINTYYSIMLRNDTVQESIARFCSENRMEALWKYIIEKGIEYNTSDIHISYVEFYIILKFRIAGGLKTFCVLDEKIGEGLVRVIKINSEIEVSKVVGSREGRILFDKNDELVDMRVSIVRTLDKEKIHIRILRFDNVPKRLEELGIESEEVLLLKKFSKLNNGCIIVCGPTGSGKSTTLRCLLQEIDNGEKHIVSVEDPVEYTIRNVTQIQVNEVQGFGFEKALRSVLRIDPDVIYIGELRDFVSAEVATSAAITGHLVLSTLHTKSALSTFDRLKDLGVENYSISNSISLIINQRLVRILCESCKEADPWNENNYRRIGCKLCNYTGISHRRPMLEMIVIGKEEKEILLKGGNLDINSVIRPLKDQIEELLKKGLISFDEGRGFLNEY